MRIDLTPSSNECAPANAPLKTEPRVHKGKRSTPEQCELLGSADFRQLLQSVYDAALITNMDGWILSGNERASQFFQYDVAQFSDLHITSLLSGSDELLMATICESLQNDRFILIQAYCMRADGSIFPAEVSVNLIHISDADYLNFFIRDITLRKEAEDRLRTGHAAIQNSGNGIAITDIEATLEYFNPAMAALLGAEEREQLDGENITSYLNNPTVSYAITDAVTNGLTWSGELEMLRLDDITLFVQASVAPNTDADDTVVGMVWSLLDISDQKRARQEIEERNAQMEEDLSLAREFQQAFIQRAYPVFPPGVDPDESILELSHIYLPSGAVGGDFFEVFSVSEHRVGVFISDVMGHGVRSALVVATIRGLIEELGPERLNPSAFLSHMNRDLTRIIKHHGHVTFATAFYMVLNLTDGKIEFASAGHPSPFLLSAATQTVSEIVPDEGKQGPALGIFSATAYETTTAKIAPDDMIMLYTDGIFEAECCTSCECFELERVSSLLQENMELSPAMLLPRLLEAAQKFCNRDDFDDDVCLVALKLKGFLAGEA
ncbi:MAG: SpoIIE family protein phosphatase [Verrucomicrobia bacterium]|nr:SpoIIE family protein phosphatase [Verrucomicrobiota bacterium]